MEYRRSDGTLLGGVVHDDDDDDAVVVGGSRQPTTSDQRRPQHPTGPTKQGPRARSLAGSTVRRKDRGVNRPCTTSERNPCESHRHSLGSAYPEEAGKIASLDQRRREREKKPIVNRGMGPNIGDFRLLHTECRRSLPIPRM